MVLEKALTRLGFGVLSARDGLEAWRLFERDRPALVITDWRMPRLDGLELCRKIRQDPRHDRYTYLIVLTALDGKKNYLEAMNAGTDDFLTKPFDQGALAVPGVSTESADVPRPAGHGGCTLTEVRRPQCERWS